MKFLLLVALLVCVAILATEGKGDIDADVNAGLKLPFLGRVGPAVDAGLGFDGGLFGIGKAVIYKLIGNLVPKKRTARDVGLGVEAKSS